MGTGDRTMSDTTPISDIEFDTITKAVELALWMERGTDFLDAEDAAEKIDLLLIDAPSRVINYALQHDWIEFDDTPTEPGGAQVPVWNSSTGNPFKTPKGETAR